MPDPVPTSENHNLPKVPPLDAEYENQWGFILNEGEFADGSDAGSDALVQALDERTPIVDTAANRDAYHPYGDALFIASDTGQVSLGDGTSWSSRGVVPNDSDVLNAIDGANISPNQIDANAVSTGKTTIGGQVAQHNYERIARIDITDSILDETIEFADYAIGQDNRTEILLRINRFDTISNASNLQLRFDNDNATTSYNHTIEDGSTLTQTTDDDKIVVFSGRDFNGYAGVYHISVPRRSPAIYGSSSIATRTADASALRHGSFAIDSGSDINNMRLWMADGTEGVDTTIEVFGRTI